MCGASVYRSIRLLKIVFQQPACRASRWPCTPLAVTPVCACVSVTTPLYWGSAKAQPQGLGVGPFGHTQRLGEFRGVSMAYLATHGDACYALKPDTRLTPQAVSSEEIRPCAVDVVIP